MFNKKFIHPVRNFYLLFLVFSTTAIAQESRQDAFISPVFKFQSAFNHASYVGGVRFGWVINNKIVIGGGFYSSLSSLLAGTPNSTDNPEALLSFNMGGLEVEYIFFKNESNHTSFLFFSGGSGLYYTTPDKSRINYSSETFLVWEPQIYSEVNLQKWLRIGVGVGYRFVSYTNQPAIRNGEQLKGMFGLLEIKFCTN